MRVTKVAFEAMLLKWSESSNGGATIVLQLADTGDLEVFKHMTLSKRNHAGQRLAVAIAEIGDDEKLVEHEVQPKAPLTVTPSVEQADLRRAHELALKGLKDAEPHDPVAEGIIMRTLQADMGTPYVDAKLAADAKAKPRFPGGFCGLSVQWCDDPGFREWLECEFPEEWHRSQAFVRMANKTAPIERASLVIKEVCKVTTRKALDVEPARALFDALIRQPYREHLEAEGVA